MISMVSLKVTGGTHSEFIKYASEGNAKFIKRSLNEVYMYISLLKKVFILFYQSCRVTIGSNDCECYLVFNLHDISNTCVFRLICLQH